MDTRPIRNVEIFFNKEYIWTCAWNVYVTVLRYDGSIFIKQEIYFDVISFGIRIISVKIIIQNTDYFWKVVIYTISILYLLLLRCTFEMNENENFTRVVVFLSKISHNKSILEHCSNIIFPNSAEDNIIEQLNQLEKTF